MKRCNFCESDKPEDEFAWRSKSRGIRVSKCKSCVNKYNKGHYQRNKEAYSAKARKWDAANVQKNWNALRLYFADHPCVDCGETDIEVLDFDHRDSSLKSFNIGSKLYSMTWAQLLIEIQKCDVRCANDHRRRTNRQFSYWRMHP